MIGGWRIAQPFGFELGEHPVWDDRTATLWCVDVYGGALVGVTNVEHARRLELGEVVGAMVLRDDGGIVALVDDSILFVDLKGVPDRPPIAVPMPHGVRFNDAACDPAGRLLFGTAALDGHSPIGALRMLDASGEITDCLEGVVESNGLAWSANGAILYFVDSIEPAIRRYEYDPAEGVVGGRLSDLARTIEYPGSPDGVAMDAAGCLWVALWEGGQLHRYAPDGELLERIETPTSRPTCPGFGGPTLGTLYLASAWEGLDPAARAGEPHSGDLFAREVDIPGSAVARLRSPR